MKEDNGIRAAVLDCLRDVAPEADLERLRADDSLREQLDIDSMDFLNFAIGLHKRLGVTIPEADYGKIATLDAVVHYVSALLPKAVGHA